MRMQNVTQTIDTNTGEVTEIIKNFNTRVKKEDFIFMLEGAFSAIMQLDKTTDIKVLILLAQHLKFNSNKVLLSPNIRKDMADAIGVKVQQISNSIKRLKDLGIVSGERNDFALSNNCFWKGSLSNKKDEKISVSRQENRKFPEMDLDDRGESLENWYLH